MVTTLIAMKVCLEMVNGTQAHISSDSQILKTIFKEYIQMF